jgi:hypothetical protein
LNEIQSENRVAMFLSALNEENFDKKIEILKKLSEKDDKYVRVYN